MPIEFKCKNCGCMGLKSQIVEKFSFLRMRKVKRCPDCKSKKLTIYDKQSGGHGFDFLWNGKKIGNIL